MLVVVAALVLTNSALANSGSLTLKLDNNDHYDFSANGSSSLGTMMCDSDDNHIFGGEPGLQPSRRFWLESGAACLVRP